MQAKDVKTKRERLGLTQVEFARLLDVAPNTVARWEQGVMAMHRNTAKVVKQITDSLLQEKRKRSR